MNPQYLIRSDAGNLKQVFYSRGTENLRSLLSKLGGHLTFYDSSIRWFDSARSVSVTARVYGNEVLYCIEKQGKTYQLAHFHAAEVIQRIKELTRELH